jgi:hypothetical protein
MELKPWWSNGYEFESHHPYLFDKNQVQGDVGQYKFQAQKIFTLKGYVRE